MTDAQTAARASAVPGSGLASWFDEAPSGPTPATAARRWPTGRGIAVALFAFGAVWLPLLAWVSLSPPDDNIEQLTWVRALGWGYYKHPPLPTWLLWAPVRLFGLSPWVTSVLGAVCTLGAMAIVWRLLCRLRGRAHATVALLAMLCISYYSLRLNYYNHDVVLMLLSAASAAATWRAFEQPGRGGWVLLGLALGLGALAKYEVAVSVTCVLAYAAHRRAWRQPAQWRGLLLAGAIALALFAPHLVWLVRHDFLPVRYAQDSALDAGLSYPQRLVEAVHWLADQLLNRALPAFLFLAVVVGTARTRNEPPAGTAQAPRRSVGDDGSRALVLIWGLVPLLFIALTALLVGAQLPLHWGLPFLLFIAPAAMEWVPRERLRGVNASRAFAAFLMVQVLLLATLQVTSARGRLADRLSGWSRFDSQDLVADVAAAARRQLGGPIRIVSGDAPVAGALALLLPERPVVLIAGRLDISPWVDPDLLRRCGALEIGYALERGKPVGPDHPGLDWRVVPPSSTAADCRR